MNHLRVRYPGAFAASSLRGSKHALDVASFYEVRPRDGDAGSATYVARFVSSLKHAKLWAEMLVARGVCLLHARKCVRNQTKWSP